MLLATWEFFVTVFKSAKIFQRLLKLFLIPRRQNKIIICEFDEKKLDLRSNRVSTLFLCLNRPPRAAGQRTHISSSKSRVFSYSSKIVARMLVEPWGSGLSSINHWEIIRKSHVVRQNNLISPLQNFNRSQKEKIRDVIVFLDPSLDALKASFA